jgi:hypothetical protein
MTEEEKARLRWADEGRRIPNGASQGAAPARGAARSRSRFINITRTPSPAPASTLLISSILKFVSSRGLHLGMVTRPRPCLFARAQRMLLRSIVAIHSATVGASWRL